VRKEESVGHTSSVNNIKSSTWYTTPLRLNFYLEFAQFVRMNYSMVTTGRMGAGYVLTRVRVAGERSPRT